MPKSLATLRKELEGWREQLAESTRPYPRGPSSGPMNYALGADRLKALIVKNVKEIDNQKKKMQEAHESRIAALNSTTLGQKLPEDVIRKISEYGGRKRKTRKGKKSTKRKTFRRRK